MSAKEFRIVAVTLVIAFVIIAIWVLPLVSGVPLP